MGTFGTVNKRKAIQSKLAQLGMQATPAQVVAALKTYGIEVSEDFVARVKAQMLRNEWKARRSRWQQTPTAKRRHRPLQRKIPRRDRT